MNSVLEITKIVDKYIERKKTIYAIMLDGAWGTGKTYFIKDNLIPELKKLDEERCNVAPSRNKRNFVYVSLYGLNDCGEILKSIWIETLPLKDKLKDLENVPGVGVLSNFGKAVFVGGLNFFNIEKPEIDIEKMLNLNHSVLIFDDVERCNIDTNELLGFINNFVEHDNIKTILVGNQSEISKNLYEKNKELKYFLGLDKRINIPDNDRQNGLTSSRQKEPVVKESFSVKELEERVEHVFHGNSEYDRIKEKLIGITIEFAPDMKNILYKLINDYVQGEHSRKLLLELKDDIVNIVNDSGHRNLRTLIFSFERFEELCQVIKRYTINIDPSYVDSFLKDVFKYVLELSVKHKTGGYIDQWDEHDEIGNVKTAEEYWNFDRVYGFKFVYDFVLFSKMRENIISEVLQLYTKEKFESNKTVEEPVITLRNGWIDFSEDRVIELCDEVDKLIDKRKLNLHLLLETISQRLQLNSIGFKFNITELVDKAKESITELDKSMLSHEPFRIRVSENITDEYKKIKSEILEVVKNQVEFSEESTLNSSIDESGKDISIFVNYVYDNKSNYMNQKKFFKLIDIKKLANCVSNSSNEDIGSIRYTINQVYSFSNIGEYFSEDVPNIEFFMLEIEKILNDSYLKDKIKIYNLELLKSQLEGYLVRLKKS